MWLSPRACAGLFYTRANERTIKLMDRITDRLNREKAWDQVRHGRMQARGASWPRATSKRAGEGHGRQRQGRATGQPPLVGSTQLLRALLHSVPLIYPRCLPRLPRHLIPPNPGCTRRQCSTRWCSSRPAPATRVPASARASWTSTSSSTARRSSAPCGALSEGVAARRNSSKGSRGGASQRAQAAPEACALAQRSTWAAQTPLLGQALVVVLLAPVDACPFCSLSRSRPTGTSGSLSSTCPP